ncbi:MAG: ribosome hibernation-promoting factor, HPF/YfiA family [bacterium]
MDFQFVGRRIELTDSLKNYARKRVGKLSKFFPDRPDQEITARVKLEVQNERQIAELQLNGDGEFFEGTASSPDMYASIDRAVDKLGQQLRKYHDKLTNHRKTNNVSTNREIASKILQMDEENGEASKTEESEPRVIRRNTYTAKPMTVEEAVLQMNSLDYDFFVFTNQVTNDINVVYNREDGDYGLIEAES